MDKKELKFYEAPMANVVELKLQGMLCTSDFIPGEGESGGTTEPTPGVPEGGYDD